MLWLLRQNPTVWRVYSHIHYHVAEKTLQGLAYASFLGFFFFVFLPLEPLYIYYLSLPHSEILVTIVMIAASIGGLIVDYMLGWQLGAVFLP